MLSLAPLSGVPISTLIPTSLPSTVTVDITGVEATGSVGSVTPSFPINRPSLTGVAAVGGVGSMGISRSSTLTLPSVAAGDGVGGFIPDGIFLPGVDAPTAISDFTALSSLTKTLPSIATPVHHGAFDPTNSRTLTSLSAPTHIGQPLAIISAEGYSMTNLNVVVYPEDDISMEVSLRYSDTKGASYGNPVLQTLGEQGQFLTSLQWRRLGMGRDRIFEVSWTTPFETSIVGAFIDFEVAET